jgi:hypothetical protein
MPSEFHHKPRYSRYFMAPVWIALALCGMGLAFLVGGYLVTDEWSRQDQDTLTDYKGVSPSSALVLAAEGVKRGRIDFAVYRDLLRGALAEENGRAHTLAFVSIRDVLRYGGAFADDLKAELEGMAPQVFITTTTSKAGIDAAEALERELRDVGMTIANREALDPAQVGESKVSCYSADTCKDAKALVSLLRDRGYNVGEADAANRSEDKSQDTASTLYNDKVIRIALQDPKQSPPAASPSSGTVVQHSPHQRRRVVAAPGVKVAHQ